MSDQLDIYGQAVKPEAEPAAYMLPAPKVEQPKLFEPQMEGQLTLE